MKEKKELKINVGGSSIILMILVFALAIFAVLSIKASNNDLKLAKKTAVSVQDFYLADAKAEEILMNIDEGINKLTLNPEKDSLKAALEGIDEIKSIEQEGALQNLTYDVEVNESATLQVVLQVNLSKEKGERYDVVTWKVKQNDLGNYDFNGFEFWDGTID